MGLRFRRSVKIAPGIKLNLGKKSAGISIGGKHTGITFNSKSGVSVHSSIPGTGLSYRAKLGKKNASHRKPGDYRSQKTLLKDVQKIERSLEEECSLCDGDESFEFERSNITYPNYNLHQKKTSSVKKKSPPDLHRPESVSSVRTQSVYNIFNFSIVFAFFSYLFYNWTVLRYGIYAFWAISVISLIKDMISASDVAEANKQFNAELDAKVSPPANQSAETIVPPVLDEESSLQNISISENPPQEKSSSFLIYYSNWKRDTNGKLFPPDTVWIAPHSKVYHCCDTCRKSIISSRSNEIIFMSENEAVQIGLRPCSRCDWTRKMIQLSKDQRND